MDYRDWYSAPTMLEMGQNAYSDIFGKFLLYLCVLYKVKL